MNKYAQVPDRVIDLHGYTSFEAETFLKKILKEEKSAHIRIITGKGNHSVNGPVLNAYVKKYLTKENIRFNQSKLQDGGEGALEVYL